MVSTQHIIIITHPSIPQAFLSTYLVPDPSTFSWGRVLMTGLLQGIYIKAEETYWNIYNREAQIRPVGSMPTSASTLLSATLLGNPSHCLNFFPDLHTMPVNSSLDTTPELQIHICFLGISPWQLQTGLIVLLCTYRSFWTLYVHKWCQSIPNCQSPEPPRLRHLYSLSSYTLVTQQELLLTFESVTDVTSKALPPHPTSNQDLITLHQGCGFFLCLPVTISTSANASHSTPKTPFSGCHSPWNPSVTPWIFLPSCHLSSSSTGLWGPWGWLAYFHCLRFHAWQRGLSESVLTGCIISIK